MRHLAISFYCGLALLLCGCTTSQPEPVNYHPAELQRIIVSSDIGGTDPDDNQSMLHLLMYSNEFDIEGIISTPSYGAGSKEEVLRMIDLYEQDLPTLQAGYYRYLAAEGYLHTDTTGFATDCFDFDKVREGYVVRDFMSPDTLRTLAKQGRRDEAPIEGFATPTEGSNWIIECARRDDERPLYVLVWGALEDVAQALHDAPEIASKLRVYWIGGPNKKWGTNAYNYLVENHPNLWMIENNASYRGFIANAKDSSEYQAGFWEEHMKGHGMMGDRFKQYYDGVPKMGDTPSLLYLLGGRVCNKSREYEVMDPADPTVEHWGGQFEKMTISPKYIITGPLTMEDTVPVYSLMEWQIEGPKVNIPYDSIAFTLLVDRQTWRGHYMGDGKYVVRYAPKAPATLTYSISSPIPGFPAHEGTFVAGKHWPAVDEYTITSSTIKACPITLGDNWYTDMSAPEDTDSQAQRTNWQGIETTSKWREDAMKDWALRLGWFE